MGGLEPEKHAQGPQLRDKSQEQSSMNRVLHIKQIPIPTLPPFQA